MKKSILFSFSILIALFISKNVSGQNDFGRPAKNSKNQEMKVQMINLKSFSVPQENRAAWEKFNKPSYSKHSEFGKLPYNAEYIGYVEVLEKRQIDERFFINEKNPTEFQVQKAMGALHHKVNGEWVTIDHRIADKGNGIYEANNQFDPVGFDVKKGRSFIKTPSGIIYFNKWTLLGSDKSGSRQLLANADWSSYTAGDDGIYVTNFFPGIDAQMSVSRGSIKTNFIVKQLNFTNYNSLLFQDEYSGPLASYFKFKGTAINAKHAASEVTLMEGNTPILEIGEAAAWPKDGTREERITAEYFLEENNLLIAVPVDWIQKNIQNGYVIVDPLVTSANSLAQASITGSMYNTAPCTFNASCNYGLAVNTPANSTLTDVKWSFNYITGGLCWLQDGGIRISTGGCISPSGAGLYWYCNTPTPGTCNGSNISIFSDLSPCLPAPSCAPVGINFTLRFYRDCIGALGCSGTCIGANSPWTMTLEGHTVEFTNLVTPFTVSSNTVCAGGNITALTAVRYGVPVRNINWSLSPGGAPSVGVGTNPTIIFPTAGTYTLYSIVTDACGITSTSQQVITVVPIPVANAGATQSLTCINNPTVLTGSGGGTYSWTGPAFSSALQNPSVGTAGIYSLVVTVNACSSPISTVQVVTNNTAPTLTSTVASSLNCTTLSTQITINTAATPVSFITTGPGITAGSTTSLVTVNAGGTYNYSVTNTNNGCVTMGSIAVTQNTSVAGVTAASNSLNCTTGSATITITSNSAAVTYTTTGPGVTGGSTTSLVTVNAGGTYNYTVTNSINTCITVGSLGVIQNTTPVTATATPAASLNCAVLSTQISIASSTTPASYTTTGTGITAGSASSMVTINQGGTFNYTVTNPFNGCLISGSVSVIQNTTAPTASINVPAVLNCTNTAMVISGSPTTGVSYNWTGPSGFTSTNANPTVTLPGSYNLTITSTANSCTNTTSASVTQNNTVSATANTAGTITCITNTISLTATPAGMNYTWTAPGGATIISGQGSSNAVGQGVGTYSLLLYNATNACTATAVIAVNVNTVQAAPNAVTGGTVTCINTAITLTSSTGGVTYTWVPPGGASVVSANSASTAANGSGVYTLNVTNTTNFCTNTQTVSAVVQTVSPNPSITNSPTITCLTPTVNISGSPLAGVSYTWTTGGGNIIGSPNNQNATVTATGIYSLAVTSSSNGCVSTSPATINVTANTVSPAITMGPNQTLPCNPASVQVTSTVSPGTATLVWTGPNVCAGANASVATVCANGVYTLTGTNPSNGCSFSNTLLVNPAVGLTVTIANTGTITCNPTTVQVVVSANPAGNTYTWSGPGIIGGAGTSTITVNQGGTYSVVVTNTTNGCTSNITNSITANNAIINPNATISNSVNCISTTATINTAPTPTVGPYSYTWAGPAVAGATTSAVAVTPTANTIYTVTVFNPSNNCSATQTVNVVASTNPPTSVVISPNSLTLTCPSPTAVLNATATGAASYSWAVGGGGSIIGVPNTTAGISGAGTYSVFAIGANGCVSAPQVSSVSPAVGLTITIANTGTITCNTATVQVVVTATPTSNTYSWTGPGIISGLGTNTITVNQNGGYSVVVTNTTNGCVSNTIMSVASATTPPTAISGTGTQTLSCTNSLVIIAPTYSPSPDLTYTWTTGGGNIIGSVNNSSIQVNQAGNYSLTVTNSLTGCSTTSIVVTVTGSNIQPTLTAASSSSIGIGCSPATSTIGLSAQSAAVGTYSWSTGALTQSIITSTAGTYTVTITDNVSGCSTSTTIAVPNNTAIPNFTASSLGNLPCGSGTTALNAVSSNSNVTYAWSGSGIVSGSNTAAATVNQPGTYTVTALDNITGCMSQTTLPVSQITVNALAVANITVGPAPLNVNFNNLSTGANTYSWSFGNGNSSSQTSPSNSYPSVGTYSVFLTAYNGSCMSVDTLIIKVLESLGGIPEIFTPNGDGKNDVFEIIGLDSYPKNSLQVFNRWGSPVYSSNPYKNDWDGAANASGKTGSGKLPSGTYFYILNLGDENNTVFKGFVQIQY